MFSKSLFTALSLLVLTASSALGAPPLSCPALSSSTAIAASSSSVAAASLIVTSSSVISSAAASATSVSSTNGKGRGGNGRGGKGKGDEGKGGRGKGGAKGATTSSALSSTKAITTSASAAASNIAIASPSTILSATASPTSTSTEGTDGTGKGGDKGATGAGAASSAEVSSATVAAASSTASVTAAPSSTATGTPTSGDDEQSATTLNPAVIATGFALDGQQTPAAGQVASLTSTNNFINFCLTVNLPLTDGHQITGQSCNPAPMGVIAAITNMPSSKFTFPKNFGTVKANTAFTVTMAVNNLETGNLVNEASNYLSAPQQVNADGNIIGHSRIAIEQLDSLNQTTPTDPSKFAFFKGISDAAVNGVLSANIANGLPAGFYRLASINAAANLQPVLVAVAQHGSLDDMVYFTVE